MTVQAPAAPASPAIKFSQMSIVQKAAFIGKVILMVVTFGFAFPNVLNR